MNIVILAGGLSPERDVSLSSGAKIAAALQSRSHRVCLVDLFLGRTDLPDNLLDAFSSVPGAVCHAIDRPHRISMR